MSYKQPKRGLMMVSQVRSLNFISDLHLLLIPFGPSRGQVLISTSLVIFRWWYLKSLRTWVVLICSGYPDRLVSMMESFKSRHMKWLQTSWWWRVYCCSCSFYSKLLYVDPIMLRYRFLEAYHPLLVVSRRWVTLSGVAVW